jgi:hypothetical protein
MSVTSDCPGDKCVNITVWQGANGGFVFPPPTEKQKIWIFNQEKLNDLYQTRLSPLLSRRAEKINMRPDGMKNKVVIMVHSTSDMEVVSAKIPEDLRHLVEIEVQGPFWH